MPESRAITALRNVYRRFAGPEASLSSIPLGLLRRIYGNRLTIRIEGEPFTVNLQDTVVSFQILATRRYEEIETALMRKLIRPGASVVDIGANIGYFTVAFGRLAAPGGKVMAIEPDPDNAWFLRKNVHDRDLESIVSIAETAVGEAEGSATLYRARFGNNGDHRLFPDGEKDGAGAPSQLKIDVPVTRLDRLLERWQRVDFIKMDIQGFEPYALRGMRETISRNRDLVLLTEFWPHGIRLAGCDPLSLIHDLRDCGFQIWRIPDRSGALERIDPEFDERMVAAVEPDRGYANLLCARSDEQVRAVGVLS